MAVLQENKNLPDHILVLKRIDTKNVFNLPLKATQRIKVRDMLFKHSVNKFLIFLIFSIHVLKYLRILSFLELLVVDYMCFEENLVNLYSYFQTK